MSLSKGRKVTLIIVGSLVAILLIALLLINVFLGEILESRINAAMAKDKNPQFHISLDNVGINVLSGNIRLEGLKLEPDSSVFRACKEGKAASSMLIGIEVPVLRIVGIEIYKAIKDRKINLKKIEFVDASLILYKGNPPVATPEEKPQKKLNLDSLQIDGIAGIEIGKIAFRKLNIELLNLETGETLLKQKLDTEISGIELNKVAGTDHYFSLNLNNIDLEMEKDHYVLPGGDYTLDLKKVNFSMAESLLDIKGLKLKTTYEDKYELAKKLKFTSEIFDISVGEIKLVNIDLARFVNKGEFFIDTVMVSKLDLGILMDKRLPFNEQKRPKTPGEMLRTMKFPLYIGHILIKDSKLKYQERMPGLETPMTMVLNDFDVRIIRATSIHDSIDAKQPMTINLKAKVMNKPALNIDFLFPLTSSVDTFFYSGSLGGAKFSIFNDASFPAMGLKFSGGTLNGIHFKGSASPRFSSGTMSLRYENLEAEFSKKDMESKSKFLSWAANTAIRKGNPGANGKLRDAQMQFTRVPYKGFGNIIWKTLQNGIMNTISPVGKVKREDSPEKQKKTEEKSEEDSKETKKERRKKKHKKEK